MEGKMWVVPSGKRVYFGNSNPNQIKSFTSHLGINWIEEIAVCISACLAAAAASMSLSHRATPQCTQ